MSKLKISSLVLIALSFGVGAYLYNDMPDMMASHWNTLGEVDGYMPRVWGLFLMPVVSLGMFLLFIGLPLIDPLKKNIEKFQKYYDGFIFLMVLFLFYVYCLSAMWNLDFRFNMGQFMMPALGVLFFYVGVLLENAKRNWLIGIRTPWTLSSDKVWTKTHKLSGKLFKACGVLAILGVFFGRFAFWFVLGPVMFTSLFAVVYSYLEFRKLKSD